MAIDYAEYSRADYSGVVAAREPACEYGVQGVFGADAYGGDVVCAGSQAGALYQGSASRDVFRCALQCVVGLDMNLVRSPIDRDGVCGVRPDRSKAVDIRQRQGYMLDYASELPDVSAQPGVLHRFGHLVRCPPKTCFSSRALTTRGLQGSDRSQPPVWRGVDIPPAGVRDHRGHVPPAAVLALAAALPAVVGAPGEHARDPQRRVRHPAGDGHQLLVVVPRRLRVPVPHPQAQLCVVDKVQLRDERGDGQRDGDFADFYIFHAAVSKGRADRGELVGERCVYEQCAVSRQIRLRSDFFFV